jgi:hypothetical protein
MQNITSYSSKIKQFLTDHNVDLDDYLPPKYFNVEENVKRPKAPKNILWRAFSLEVLAILASFPVLIWYFNSQQFTQTVSKFIQYALSLSKYIIVNLYNVGGVSDFA